MSYLDEYKIEDFEYDDEYYDVTLYDLQFYDEPAQKRIRNSYGEQIDPSWDAYSVLESCKASVEKNGIELPDSELTSNIKDEVEKKHEENILNALYDSNF